MLKKLITIIAALLLVTTFQSPAAADDWEDAEFANALLAKYGFLDLAEEIASELRNKTSCPTQAKLLALNTLKTIYKWYIDNPQEEGDREKYTKMYKDVIEEIEKLRPGGMGGQTELDLLLLEFQNAERTANLVSEAKNEEEQKQLKKEAQTAFDNLLKKVKPRVEELQKEAAKLEEARDSKQRGSDAYNQAQRQLYGVVFLRNSMESLYGDITFSYGMFFRRLGDEVKAEDYIKKSQEWMKIFIDGTEDMERLDRWEIPELKYPAHITLGKAYLELGNYERAIEYLGYMMDPGWPYPNREQLVKEDPKFVEYIDNVVFKTRCQAYRWTAEAYMRQSEKATVKAEKDEYFNSALITIEELFQRVENAIGSDAGKAARMLQGEAYEKLGKYLRAITAIYEIYAGGEEMRLKLPSLKHTGAQVNAARFMSGIFEKKPTLQLNPEISFAVGKGLFWRENWELAALCLKDSLSTEYTVENRIREAEALFDLGSAYHFMNSWYQSGFAFIELVEEFKDDELETFPTNAKNKIEEWRMDAAKFARTAFDKHKGESKADDKWLAKVYKKIEDYSAPDDVEIAKFNDGAGTFNEAIKLFSKEMFKEARAKLEEALAKLVSVQPTVKVNEKKSMDVKKYGEARFFAGLAAMKILQCSMAGGAKEVEFRDKAAQYFMDSYEWAMEPRKGVEKAALTELEAKSRFYYAEIFMTPDFWEPTDSARERAKKAAMALAPYDERLAGEKKYIARAWRRQNEAYLEMEEFDKAVEKFRQMDEAYREFKKSGATDVNMKEWQELVTYIAYMTATSLRDAGQRLETLDELDKAKTLYNKASEIVTRWKVLKLESGEEFDFRDRLVLIDMNLKAGKIKEAREALVEFIDKYKANAYKLDEARKDAYFRFKLKLAECAEAEGDFKGAAQQYYELMTRPPFEWVVTEGDDGKHPINVAGQRIKCLIKTESNYKKDIREGQFSEQYMLTNDAPIRGYARNMYKDFKKNGTKDSLNKAIGAYAKMYSRVDDSDPAKKWGIILKTFQCYYDLPDYQYIWSQLQSLAFNGYLEKLYVDLPAYHKKIVDLWKKVNKNLKIKKDKYLEQELARYKNKKESKEEK